ncbi:hypothetical protein Bca4012_017630 [Brassica carinata]
MDPRPPFNQSGGYTGLMHSQHDSVGFGNSPYEIPPFSSQGSSQIPQFPSPKWVNLNTTKGSKRKGGETCSQDSVTGVVEEEVRPEGVKAAKANRSGAWKGKSVADIKTVAALRKEEFESKEKLSKLAILDTLLAKTQALSEAEDFGILMGVHSYSQPSQDDTFPPHHSHNDSEYDEIEALIQEDQAQLEFSRSQATVVYPPQPEVEFGFPQICYCGSQPTIKTCKSRTDPGRRYYTCPNVDDGEFHVHKWWDDAVMEEMRARDRHTLQLAEKVDSLTMFNDYHTDQKIHRLENMMCDLGKDKPRSSSDYLIVVLVMVLIFIGLVIIFM